MYICTYVLFLHKTFIPTTYWGYKKKLKRFIDFFQLFFPHLFVNIQSILLPLGNSLSKGQSPLVKVSNLWPIHKLVPLLCRNIFPLLTSLRTFNLPNCAHILNPKSSFLHKFSLFHSHHTHKKMNEKRGNLPKLSPQASSSP